MHNAIKKNLQLMIEIMDRKDANFENVKNDMTLQLIEKRKREEGLLLFLFLIFFKFC
jgi:hypothetical protein